MWIAFISTAGHGGDLRHAGVISSQEIDTSLGRRLNSSESADGPRVESGGLPDSSTGEEDFAARRRKRHARPLRFPAGFLRTFPAFFSSVHDRFNRVSEKIRDRYQRCELNN
jgi:hypothetical protein